jgi:hypothetical protein
VGTRARRLRQRPIRISYQDFRSAASGCCAGTEGDTTTALGTLIARDLKGIEPTAMLEELLGGQPGTPVHGVWHHALVGEVLLVCLRNAGYAIGDNLVDEVIDRGRQIAGGSCGFLGVCGALASAASAYAILLASTPVATPARERLLDFSARLAARLARIGGSRCCKKSSYVALQMARDEFADIGFELPRERFAGRCPFSGDNETCDGTECAFFPRPGGRKRMANGALSSAGVQDTSGDGS